MKSIKSDFISSGVRCDGDLYLPEGADRRLSSRFHAFAEMTFVLIII